MHQLQTLLKSSPLTSTIILEYEFIRDLTLCMKTLKKFPNLRTLSLHGNQLKILPLMSDLEISILDLTHNPLKIDNYLLDSLYSLTTLEHLSIDGTEDEMERILENLPNLKTLNGKKIIREKIGNKHQVQHEIKIKRELSKEQDKVKSLAMTIFSRFEQPDKDILGEFDENFKEIVDEYQNFSNSVAIDTAKEGVFLFSKNKLIDWVFEQFVNLLAAQGHENIATSLEQINLLKKEYFDNLLKIVLQVGYNEACLEDDLGEELSNEMKNIKLRKQKLYLKQIMRLKKKINDYQVYVKKLEEENSKQMATLYSLTRSQFELDKSESKSNLRASELLAPMSNLPLGLSNRQAGEKSPISKNKQTQSQALLTPSKSVQKLRDENAVTPKSKSKEKYTKNNKILLNYDQTVKTMWDFVDAKQKHNQKCLAKKLPYETAEQFITDFFTSKFGSKSKAIGYGVNFIRSLQIYAKENTLCEVLLKILKNSVEESFFMEHHEFAERIRREMAHQVTVGEALTATEAQNIFFRHFPMEDEDQFKVVTNFSVLNADTMAKELCRAHVKSHERLIQEFHSIFRVHDGDEDGVLSYAEARDFIATFFKPKVEKAVVTHNLVEKILRKLEVSKKARFIFSQLVDTIDKIV